MKQTAVELMSWIFAMIPSLFGLYFPSPTFFTQFFFFYRVCFVEIANFWANECIVQRQENLLRKCLSCSGESMRNTCTCRTEGVRLSAWKILRFYGWGHKWSYFFLSAFLQNSFHVATIVLQLLHEAFVSLKKVTERVLLCNLFVLLLVCVRTKSHILDNRLTTELFFITLLSLFCFWLKFIFLN